MTFQIKLHLPTSDTGQSELMNNADVISSWLKQVVCCTTPRVQSQTTGGECQLTDFFFKSCFLVFLVPSTEHHQVTMKMYCIELTKFN